MKRTLWVLAFAMLLPVVAHAVVIGVYSDASGSSADLQSGFSDSYVIIMKYAQYGTYGARFAVVTYSGAETQFYGFVSPYTQFGALGSDITIGTGECLTGDIVLGSVVACWAPGHVVVVPPAGYANVIWLDCNFGEDPGVGLDATITGPVPTCELPVKTSTWGSVKALYRN